MKLALTTAVAVFALAACASTSSAPDADEHAAHHPSAAGVPAQAPADYEHQMMMMQEMHQKMAAAKSPEERAALMKEHMKTMRDGMAMMGQMRGMTAGGMGRGAGTGSPGSGMAMDADMMKRRNRMMEMMMDMTMDCEGMKPPVTK